MEMQTVRSRLRELYDLVSYINSKGEAKINGELQIEAKKIRQPITVYRLLKLKKK